MDNSHLCVQDQIEKSRKEYEEEMRAIDEWFSKREEEQAVKSRHHLRYCCLGFACFAIWIIFLVFRVI